MWPAFKASAPTRRSLQASFLAAAAWGLLIFSSVAQADRIILRNFDVLNNVTVESFDEDGIKLSGDKQLTWDQIEAGVVAAAKQPEFDRMLKQLGDPLYRIRQRLSIGDYRGQLGFSEKLETVYAARSSDPAYWVALGLMWGRLAEGRREAALAPYLRCMEIRRQRAVSPPRAPGERRLVIDPKTGLCADLEPIWFDAKAAQAELPKLLQAITAVKQPRPPAVRIYFGSMAITAGENERAASVLGQALEGPAEPIRRVLLAQQMIASGKLKEADAALTALIPTLPSESKPLGVYWLGVARTEASDVAAKQRGLLELLRLPAIYGKQHPDLAAAGLHRAMEVLDAMGDASGGVRVRRELLQQYSQTYHASLQKNPSNTEEKR